MHGQSETHKGSESVVISRALSILERRLKSKAVYADPNSVTSFLRLQSQGLAHEVFGIMCLDTQNRLIDYEQLFRGTLTRAAVYTREIVKHVLIKNAAAVVLHHNHPSGCCMPSLRDDELTAQLRHALELVEVRLLDHVITSDEGAFSMTLEHS